MDCEDKDFDWSPGYAYKVLGREFFIRGLLITCVFLGIYIAIDLLSLALEVSFSNIYFMGAVGLAQGIINARILIRGLVNQTGLGRGVLILSTYFILIALFVGWLLIGTVLDFSKSGAIAFTIYGLIFSFIFTTKRIILDT